MVSSIGNDSSTVAQVLQQQRQQIETQQVEAKQDKQAQNLVRQEQIKSQEIDKTDQQQRAADERRGGSVDISV